MFDFAKLAQVGEQVGAFIAQGQQYLAHFDARLHMLEQATNRLALEIAALRRASNDRDGFYVPPASTGDVPPALKGGETGMTDE